MKKTGLFILAVTGFILLGYGASAWYVPGGWHAVWPVLSGIGEMATSKPFILLFGVLSGTSVAAFLAACRREGEG